MSFLSEKRLYEVEITGKCNVKGTNYFLKILGAIFITDGTAVLCPPNTDIPIGTTGWIIKQWGGKYFLPKSNLKSQNPLLDEQSSTLIPYKNIKDHYKILSNI
ncbi:MAG: hypothetical protein K0R54_1045 [Clostridiaceae bacterium]|jgi:hypothetical protein|nr:hypothetical protein [Clostridiaceae bacterium]